MEDKLTILEPLLEKIEAYTKSSIELYKYKTLDKFARVFATIALNLILVFFLSMFLIMVNIGLALWLGRGCEAMPALLAIHLGVVMALFATLPYGKFAHGIFRTAALLRFAVEKRQPNSIGVGSE